MMRRNSRAIYSLAALIGVLISFALAAVERPHVGPLWSEINNRNYIQNELAWPRVEQAWPFLSGGSDWTYAHHPHITFFKGRFHVIFSNGHEKEDRSGQRVMLSTSLDFKSWTIPAPIAEPALGPDGNPVVFTAAGFHEYKGTLVVYIGQYEENKADTGCATSQPPMGSDGPRSMTSVR